MGYVEKKIIKHGNSLVISLTKELKKLELKKGNTILVIPLKKLFIITKEENMDKKAILIQNDDFVKLRYLIKKYENKDIDEFLDENIMSLIKKYESPWTRPAVKIK